MNRVWLLVTIGAILCCGACKARKSVNPGAGNHPVAPAFSLTDINGKPLNLADFKGKVILLDFWATWCAPCKVEIPHFIEMQKKYGPQGLQIVGLSMDDDAKPVREFVQKIGINYPVAVANEDIAEQYGGVLGLPVAFIIDQNGTIITKHVGETKAEDFEKDVETLLK